MSEEKYYRALPVYKIYIIIRFRTKANTIIIL